MAPRPWSLADISLRERERGFIAGGVGAGKSTLADMLGAEFVHRYARRNGFRLILDSKPRYRAQWTTDGRSAARRYKGWDHGTPIAGSVVIDRPEDIRLALETGHRTLIAQCEDRGEYLRLVATAQAFLKMSRAKRPQLCQVDETLDFFHGNGSPIGGNDTIVQLARAGRERGTSVLYGAQRTKGIPATLMAELTKLYAMRIDYVADAKRFQEMGAPAFPNPTVPYEFYYWTKQDYAKVYGPCVLALPAR